MLSIITDFFDKLEPVDILRAAALKLFFFAILFVDRRRHAWFQGETAVLSLGGLMWIFMPQVLVGIQTTATPDALHVFIGQVFGVGLISLACSHGRNDKGENVNLSRIIAGFSASSACIVAAIYGYVKYANDQHHFTVQFFTFGLLMMSLWCIGSMIMAYRECSNGVGYNSYEDPNRQLVIHQLIDLCILALAASQHLGNNVNLKEAINMTDVKVDGIHLTMFRALGGIFMYKCMMVLSTLIFQSEDPAVNAEQARDNFMSRIVFFVMTNGFVLYHEYINHMFRSDELFMSITLGVIVIINSLLGMKAAEKDINN